jgi:hypothetical protein
MAPLNGVQGVGWGADSCNGVLARTRAKEGSISFLKKRNKKLFLCTDSPESIGWFNRSKSFLVLFFKKRTAFFG